MFRRQIICISDGDFEETTDLVIETVNEIFTACKNGSVRELETVLNSLESDKLGRYLNAMINDHHLKVHLTPLMIASAFGQDSIVRFLLEHYSHHCIIDAQNYSSNFDVDFGCYDEHFNKQTALWLAVKFKHLNVVRTLISLGKANVNHRADERFYETNWSLLGLACRSGQLEMVKYLIENGADLYNADKNDSTSLMIASGYGHYDLVQYLLSLDGSTNHLLNAINNKGSTALHEAANRRRYEPREIAVDRSFKSCEIVNRTLDIVKLLLEQHQAKIVKDNDGSTPLTIAGISENEELVKYFIENEKQSWYTTSQVIDEFELIGSHYLELYIRSHSINFEKLYHYLLRAMELRYRDPKAPILKTNLLSPIKVYGHYTECQTIGELESIKDYPDRIILEYLLILERMGVTSRFLGLLNYLADHYRSYERFRLALQLYLHAYDLRIKTQIGLDKCISDLEECAITMHEMIDDNKTKKIKFDLFIKILQATENEFIKNRNFTSTLNVKQKKKKCIWSSNKIPDIEKYDADKCLYIILNLLFIGIKILECSGKEEQERRKIIVQRVQQIIDLDWRTISDNKTLLHLSVMEYHNCTDIGIVTDFPSLSVVKLLLFCRASINAIDCHHSTPLHELAENRYKHFGYHGEALEYYSDEELNDVEIIFKLFVDAGAHLDAVAGGLTPGDCAKHEKLKRLFRMHPIQLSLKCICARMIQNRELNYTDCISKHLQSFIQLH